MLRKHPTRRVKHCMHPRRMGSTTPARAVRPILCMNSTALLATSYWITCATSFKSRPAQECQELSWASTQSSEDAYLARSHSVEWCAEVGTCQKSAVVHSSSDGVLPSPSPVQHMLARVATLPPASLLTLWWPSYCTKDRHKSAMRPNANFQSFARPCIDPLDLFPSRPSPFKHDTLRTLRHPRTASPTIISSIPWGYHPRCRRLP